MATAIVRHAGARHVVVSEPNPFRRELAVRMGATIAVDPRERDLGDVMRELGMVEGYDVVLEMSGNPRALRDALAVMAHGGNMALLGIPSEEVAIDLNEVVFKMLTIRGIYGREMYETWYAMSVLVAAGLDITPVITHRFPYHQFEEAFDTASSGRCGKVLLDWSEV
jgi:threonine 3-dehydrogenase